MSESGRPRLEGQAGSKPRPRLITAGLIGLGGVGLAVLIVTNQASIVTRGPALADDRLDAIWGIVKGEQITEELSGDGTKVTEGKPPTAAELEDANRRVVKVLRREPLNSIAISLLANIRLRQGKDAAGEALMVAAERINHRENIADLWLFDRLLARKDYEGAFRAADALLRREKAFSQQLFPQLISSMNDPKALDALAKRLAKGPDWRPGYTDAIGQSTTNTQSVFRLLAAIKAAGGQITHDEMASVVARLVSLGRFEEAYLDWLILMPDEATAKLAYVYDGDFENLPDARPFGWALSGGTGAYVETPPGHGDDALHVNYAGQANPDFAAQLVVIPPGRYELTGEVMTSSRDTEGKLAWQINCMDGLRTPLLSAPAPAADGQWRSFSIAFTVPAGCQAQGLALRRVGLQRTPELDIWYDKLNIRPAGGAR